VFTLAPIALCIQARPECPANAGGDHWDLMPLDRLACRRITAPDHCRDLGDRPKLARVLLINPCSISQEGVFLSVGSRSGLIDPLVLALTFATSGASAKFFGAVPAKLLQWLDLATLGAALRLRRLCHASTSIIRASVVSTREIPHSDRTPCSTSRSSTTGIE